MKASNQPAFPYAFHLPELPGEPDGISLGMTMRQYYAGLAMAGLLADHKDHADECRDGETCEETVARLAVQHADALLAQLEK